MLENWLMPQFNEDSNDYIFQQDGSPAQYDLYRRLRVQFLIPLMMGAVTPETCRVILQ